MCNIFANFCCQLCIKKLTVLAVWLPFLLTFLLLHKSTIGIGGDEENNLVFDLADAHLPYFFSRRPDLLRACQASDDCSRRYSTATITPKCWGYEKGCDLNGSYSNLQCPGTSRWSAASSKAAQMDMFWRQADFGYIKDRIDQMRVICDSSPPSTSNDSFLECSDHLRYCFARNIFFDFKSLKADAHSAKYRNDVIHEDEVGGRCRSKFDRELLRSRADHHGFLQSWAAELSHFESYDSFEIGSDGGRCDVIFDGPTILLKLDAGVSMYHHFCDFINLYASQHINGSFDRQLVQLLIWETSGYEYSDLFGDVWRVFSSQPIRQLREFDGRRVCFRQVMMPLLARMQFGIYYNMPLVGGCHGSGLFHAFGTHMLHRLGVERVDRKAGDKIRITFLSRDTPHRQILNQDELVGALKTLRAVEVSLVDFGYQKLPFLDQLRISANSDIFIGIHGSGLTHLLFLPDWAALFELYNCDDAGCYSDLASLRGVKYFTWEKSTKVEPEDAGHHPTLGAHAKFTNYRFDVDEFVRVVQLAIDYVFDHPTFVAEHRRNQLIIQTKKEEL